MSEHDDEIRAKCAWLVDNGYISSPVETGMLICEVFDAFKLIESMKHNLELSLGALDREAEENESLKKEIKSRYDEIKTLNQRKGQSPENPISLRLPEVKNRKGLSIYLGFDQDYAGFHFRRRGGILTVTLGFIVLRVIPVSEAHYNRFITVATIMESSSKDLVISVVDADSGKEIANNLNRLSNKTE